MSWGAQPAAGDPCLACRHRRWRPDVLRRRPSQRVPTGGGDADRILKGTNPADLPIYLPTKFELVLNLTTAKTLAIDVPLSLMLRADEMLD